MLGISQNEHYVYRALVRLEGNGVLITKTDDPRGEWKLQNLCKGSPMLLPSPSLLNQHIALLLL